MTKPKVEPGPRNREAIAEAAKRCADRPVRVQVEWWQQPDGTVSVGAPHSDPVGHVVQLASAFGTTSSAFWAQQLGSLEWATRGREEKRGASTVGVNAALALVEAVGARDEIEAALAVQMAGCHALTMEMLGRAKTSDRIDHTELYGTMAIKLQRTFTAQIEALARLRGKGQQTVRVEHVTVHPGGQAIVGDVHHHPRGARGKSKAKGQPHGTGEPAKSAALLSSDPQGNGVPVPGDAERPMQAARRPVPRRAQGKSECA